MKQVKLESKHSTHQPVFQLHPLRQAISNAVISPHAHKQWVGGVVAATLIGLASPAFGQILELSDLDGSNGFKINGEADLDFSGQSVSAAGDVNGDGIDDVIIGASDADPNGTSSGSSYVVFGSDQGFSTPLELSSLDGSNGFKLNGEARSDLSGIVSGAGDVNGDGIDDLIIGARGADPNGIRDSGASYVVFGSDQDFSSTFELSSLDGSNGFKLNGEAEEDSSGRSVSAAGDVNDDGIDDLIIGATFADPNGRSSGASYVVFGNDQEFSTPLELSSLNGTNGFKINGEATQDRSGTSVSAAGDVNGDGIDDVIIGGSGSYSYVVFGSDQGFITPIELSSLEGNNGFKINGDGGESTGKVSGAGDVNGDGIADVIIGAIFADPNGRSSGASYVVFGNDQGFSTPLELSSLNGRNGFKLNGEATDDRSGDSVSGAGDVNGDGIDDMIIGTAGAGKSYVVFGSNQGFSTPIELSSLDATTGFKINGGGNASEPGRKVSGAGDVNGDGIDDVIIGASAADPNGEYSGASYVVFGARDGGQAAALPMLAPIGDIAVLVHDAMANTVTATIKDAEDGSFIEQISFNENRTPVAFKVMTDINANGVSELVLLGQGQGSVQAEVRDSLTGALLGTVDFDPDVTPIDFQIVPDQDGNGIPELAVLGENPVQVETRDALTGNMVSTVSYIDNMTPKNLVILPDLNGKGGPEIGVLGEHDDPNKSDRVEIRDLLTGKWVRNLYYGKYKVHQAEVVPDLNYNGTPEVAVLRTTDGRVNVLIRDAASNAFVNGYGFDPNYAPGELLVVPDVNDNDASEIAVFGKNPNNQTQKALVRDGKTKQRIRNVFFNKTIDPADLVVIPDINGNGASEIGMLGTRPDNGLTRLIIKDSKSGALVGTVNF